MKFEQEKLMRKSFPPEVVNSDTWYYKMSVVDKFKGRNADELENKCEKGDVKKVLVPKISIIIQSKLILKMNKVQLAGQFRIN